MINLLLISGHFPKVTTIITQMNVCFNHIWAYLQTPDYSEIGATPYSQTLLKVEGSDNRATKRCQWSNLVAETTKILNPKSPVFVAYTFIKYDIWLQFRKQEWSGPAPIQNNRNGGRGDLRNSFHRQATSS